MSAELRGVPAAPGVAIAAPWLYASEDGADGRERRSLDEASAVASHELATLADRLREAGRDDEAQILDAQALMAGDPELLGPASELIASGVDPSGAVSAAAERIAGGLEALDDEVLAARGADVRDVAARISRHITGASAPTLERRSIVVAADLPPSVTLELDRDLLAGMALQGGSRTSHASILARSLGIPAVVAVPDVIAAAGTATEIALDGASGIVIVDPDADARERLGAIAAALVAERDLDADFTDRPLATSDGHRLVCAANIGHPDEAEPAFAAGAEAIGLFRTEFAFAGRSSAPGEEEQLEAYARVLDIADGAPVVIRLADIGGDKPLPYVLLDPEANPFLGVRAIRLIATHRELYATQVRAILRASLLAGERAAIMAPMVADEHDISVVRDLIEEARTSVPRAPAPRLGIMVEVPSAVMLAERLAGMVDFMSIGTNDLTQYLLAADRGNPALADRQDPLHPAVLRAVGRVVEGARGTECEVAVCGEMAGDPAGALLLVGLGVDELSMERSSFSAVKRAVAESRRDDLVALAAAAAEMSSAAEVRAAVMGR